MSSSHTQAAPRLQCQCDCFVTLTLPQVHYSLAVQLPPRPTTAGAAQSPSRFVPTEHCCTNQCSFSRCRLSRHVMPVPQLACGKCDAAGRGSQVSLHPVLRCWWWSAHSKCLLQGPLLLQAAAAAAAAVAAAAGRTGGVAGPALLLSLLYPAGKGPGHGAVHALAKAPSPWGRTIPGVLCYVCKAAGKGAGSETLAILGAGTADGDRFGCVTHTQSWPLS
jgi:hypothetical protein